MVTITGYAVEEVSGIAPFDNVIQLLKDFGFFRVVLPFMLIFAVFYAVLIKTQVLGTPDKNPASNSIAAIVSIVAAFFVVAYTPVVDALAIIMPQASFMLIILMLFLMLLAFIVPDFNKALEGKGWKTWGWIPAIFFIFVMLAIVGSAVGDNVPILSKFTKFVMGSVGVSATSGGGFTMDPSTLNLLIGLLVAIGIPVLVVIIVVFSGKSRKPASMKGSEYYDMLKKKEEEREAAGK